MGQAHAKPGRRVVAGSRGVSALDPIRGSDVDRMRQLAERSETGELTDDERAEFDSYLHSGNLLAVIQSKARLALRRR